MTVDHREAAANAKAEKARAKAMRPWYKKKRFWVLGVIVLLVIGGALGSGGGDDKAGDVKPGEGTSDHPAVDDVAIASCAVSANDFAGWSAQLTVTNHSSKRSNYIINVAFDSSDGSTQLDTALQTVNDLQPGQSTNVEALGLKSATRSTPATCKIADVTRLASDG